MPVNNDNTKDIIFLSPTFSHTVWGGSELRTAFGYDEPGDDIGECWGISAHPQGDDTVSGGVYDGLHLSELWDAHRELFGNAPGEVFPLLVKIITAKDDLSIQVHPDDEYAHDHENGALGKTECWYILDAAPGSELVVGHNARTKEELCEMIDNGRWSELIRRVSIRPGDYIQIPPGTVHAICGGVTLLETQQSSDITYRLYDYDRRPGGKPRDLHLAQSKAVIRVPAEDSADLIGHDSTDEEVAKLISCRYYEIYRISCTGSLETGFDRPFMLMSVVDGEGEIILPETGMHRHAIHKGSHFIVPSGCGRIEMFGNLKIIASCLPDQRR